MQHYVVSHEGSGEISQLSLSIAPSVSFQMSSSVSNFKCFLYPHSITVFDFTTNFACLLNKVFIDIHCFIQHNKKYGIHNIDVWVFDFLLNFFIFYSIDTLNYNRVRLLLCCYGSYSLKFKVGFKSVLSGTKSHGLSNPNATKLQFAIVTKGHKSV